MSKIGKKNNPERELLEMECDLARLKLNLSQKRLAQTKNHHLLNLNNNKNNLLVGLMDSAASVISTSRQSPFWQLALLPVRGRNRIFLGIFLILMQFWSNQKSSNSSNSSYQSNRFKKS